MPSKASKKKASLRAPLQQQAKKKSKKSKKRARQNDTAVKSSKKKVRENNTSSSSTTTTSSRQATNNKSSQKKFQPSTATSSTATAKDATAQQNTQQNTLANADAIEVGSKALRHLVQSHVDLCYLGTGKVKCIVTAHEMAPEEDVVRQHLDSKRYALEKGYQMNYDHLLPWIQPSREDRRKLICTLTGHELNKIPSQLELHTNSKRYKRLKEEADEKLRRKEERQQLKEEKRKARVTAAIARKAAGEDIDVAQTVMEQETSEEESSGESSEGESSDEGEEDEALNVDNEVVDDAEADIEGVETKLAKSAEGGNDFSWILRTK